MCKLYLLTNLLLNLVHLLYFDDEPNLGVCFVKNGHAPAQCLRQDVCQLLGGGDRLDLLPSFLDALSNIAIYISYQYVCCDRERHDSYLVEWRTVCRSSQQWLLPSLSLRGKGVGTIAMEIDKQYTIQLSKSHAFHDRNKHINTSHHCILGVHQGGKSEGFESIAITEQLAGILSRALGRDHFLRSALQDWPRQTKPSVQGLGRDLLAKTCTC